MMQVFLTLGILTALAAAVVIVIRNSGDEVTKKEVSFETFEEFCAGLHEYITNITSISYAATVFVSKKEARDFEHERKDRSSAARKCTNGSEGTRERTKQMCRDYVAEYLGKNSRKARARLSALVDFVNPSDYVMWETLLYTADRENNEGLARVWEDLDVSDVAVIRREALCNAYKKHVPAILSDEDKREVLVQMGYAKVMGLGVIDSLRYQKGIVEEIQLGVSGPPISAYSHKERRRMTEDGERKVRFSYDSIHIMVGGDVFQLMFLGFGSENEIERVIKAILKNTPAGELTLKDSAKITEGVDGARYLCMRPRTTDRNAAFIRKFDTATIISLKDMYKKVPNGHLSVRAIAAVVGVGKNIIISGLMASGKTVLARAIVSVLPKKARIRTVEVGSLELDLNRHYPDRNILPDRIDNESMNVDEVIGIVKKQSAEVGFIGELTTRELNYIYTEFVKFMKQVIATGHFISTDAMVSDFVESLLNHGYTSERLAEKAVVSALKFDIHIENINRRRFIEYINEIEYLENEPEITEEDLKKMSTNEQIAAELHLIRRNAEKTQNYRVRELLRWNYDTETYEFIDEMSEDSIRSFCLKAGIKRSDYPGFRELVVNDRYADFLMEGGMHKQKSVPCEDVAVPDAEHSERVSDMDLSMMKRRGGR